MHQGKLYLGSSQYIHNDTRWWPARYPQNSMFGTKSLVERQSQKTKSIRAASPINWRQWVEFPGEEAFMARDGGWRGLCVFTCRKVWAKTKSDGRATSGRSRRPSGSHAGDQRRPLTSKAHCVPKGGRSRAGRQVGSGSPVATPALPMPQEPPPPATPSYSRSCSADVRCNDAGAGVRKDQKRRDLRRGGSQL